MPEWCVTTRCIDCESHAIVSGKLACNYMNRLGLAQPMVTSFMGPTEKTPEQIEAEIKSAEEATKALGERIKQLKGITGQYEQKEETKTE